MPDYVSLVMFAIQAAIRLGQKAVTVYGEEVRDDELVLPSVEVDNPEIPSWPETERFFEREGKSFVAKDAIYSDWWQNRDTHPHYRDKLCQAHLAIRLNIDEIHKADDLQSYFRRNPEKFYAASHALLKVKQWRDGHDPKRHPVQRLAGTILELALDYAKADPTLFGGNGRGDRLIREFLLSLDEVSFAEDDYDDLLLDIARASLNVCKSHSGLIISEANFAPLLKNFSETLAENLKKIRTSKEPDKLLAFNRIRREVLDHLVTTTATTLSGYPASFLGGSKGEQLLKEVLTATLQSVQGHPDLFSSSAVSSIFSSSLKAAAENMAFLIPANKDGEPSFLTNLLTGVASELARGAAGDPYGLLTLDILPEVTGIALQVLGSNARGLIDADNPEQQLLVTALHQINQALATEFHGSKRPAEMIWSLLSRDYALAFLKEVFEAVGRHPQGLLQRVGDAPQSSALVQILGSVASAATSDTCNLLNGASLVKLLQIVLRAFANNPDRLIDLHAQNPDQSVMAQVMTSVLTAAASNRVPGRRNLPAGEDLTDLIELALREVSKNTEGFKKETDIVSMVLDRLLFAASNSLANELDSKNLLLVFTPILRQALRGREALDVSDAQLILPHLQP